MIPGAGLDLTIAETKYRAARLYPPARQSRGTLFPLMEAVDDYARLKAGQITGPAVLIPA
jgi:hypothetical protein